MKYLKCPECKSDNTIPSFTIPTWKCLDCGHIYPEYDEVQSLHRKANEGVSVS